MVVVVMVICYTDVMTVTIIKMIIDVYIDNADNYSCDNSYRLFKKRMYEIIKIRNT